MPLDEFQQSVLRTLRRLRTPASVFAGGAVLQRHGFRLSDDQDIFHPAGGRVAETAARDAAALRETGFTVDVQRPYEGLAQAVISRDGRATRIQWIEAGSWTFFAPVPDPDYGWRLHMADLAVNKALAAGGRRQARDYADLLLVHRHIMPLWHAIWAAPGKDESWSPASLAEKIAMTNNFRQVEFDEEIVATTKLSAREIGTTVRAAIDEARAAFESLPDRHAGRLFVDRNGGLVDDLDAIGADAPGIQAIAAERGGTWSSDPKIDDALIARVIAAFGRDGSKAGA